VEESRRSRGLRVRRDVAPAEPVGIAARSLDLLRRAQTGFSNLLPGYFHGIGWCCAGRRAAIWDCPDFSGSIEELGVVRASASMYAPCSPA